MGSPILLAIDEVCSPTGVRRRRSAFVAHTTTYVHSCDTRTCPCFRRRLNCEQRRHVSAFSKLPSAFLLFTPLGSVPRVPSRGLTGAQPLIVRHNVEERCFASLLSLIPAVRFSFTFVLVLAFVLLHTGFSAHAKTTEALHRSLRCYVQSQLRSSKDTCPGRAWC